jgi:hypothetical protein
MKRLFLLLLLVLGLPFWLCARSSHGKRFFQVLLLAFAIMMTIAFVISEHLLPLPAPLMAITKSKLAEWFFISAFIGFIWQLVTRFLANPAVPIQPWSTGSFHFWSGWPVLTDLLVIGWVLFIVYTGTFGPAFDPVSLAITGTSAGAFFILACVGYLNHGTLPLEPGQSKPVKPRRPPRPFLSYLKRMPKAARDDLGAIFSRRHPALQKINNGEPT